MSGINPETVVMMGAALTSAGQVSAQDVNHAADEKTISWDDAQKKALIEDLKAQCEHMSDGVQRVLDTYDLDKLKEVKATLKADGERFNYMLDGNKYSLSGGFDGKPFNMEITSQDGSKIQTSVSDTRSSTVMYDENGQLTGVLQMDERSGNIKGRFQSDGMVFDVTQKGQNIEGQLRDEDMKFAFSQNGNKVSLEANGEDFGNLKSDLKLARDGGVVARATYAAGTDAEEVSKFDMKVKRNGEMRLATQTADKYGIRDALKAEVTQQGYAMETIEAGEKNFVKGTEVNAAMLKAMLEKRIAR